MNARPLVMGILNVTPDSFSDGGKYFNADAAISRGVEQATEGADIIDIGGESTRPGAAVVNAVEESDRVLPVIKVLADEFNNSSVRISIDTRKEDVARAALEAGAQILNDVSASLDSVAAEFQVPWIAMHMQGDPQTMQANPRYENVTQEVKEFLVSKATNAKTETWIDPGIGFGKTFENNIELLSNVDQFVATELPVVIGASRKSFIREITGEPDATRRLDASLAAALWCAERGVKILRVHDIAETVNALNTWVTISGRRSEA
jgi:dihydropteroate synthase